MEAKSANMATAQTWDGVVKAACLRKIADGGGVGYVRDIEAQVMDAVADDIERDHGRRLTHDDVLQLLAVCLCEKLIAITSYRNQAGGIPKLAMPGELIRTYAFMVSLTSAGQRAANL